MARILSIDTSTDTCSVALHEKGVLLANELHKIEKSHSSLLPGIAEEVLKKSDLIYAQLQAVAVSAGPGSYTGLRIGASTAKGFSYALSIPLIAVDTTDIMIAAVAGKMKGAYFLCPMIDARRMEVYMKVVDEKYNTVWPLQAKILESDTFSDFSKPVYLFGNGMPKYREIASGDHLIYLDDIFPDAVNMGHLAYEKYQQAIVEDVAYFEPNYLKEWRTTSKKKQLI